MNEYTFSVAPSVESALAGTLEAGGSFWLPPVFPEALPRPGVPFAPQAGQWRGNHGCAWDTLTDVPDESAGPACSPHENITLRPPQRPLLPAPLYSTGTIARGDL